LEFLHRLALLAYQLSIWLLLVVVAVPYLRYL
jgi:hypothetical protein